MSPNRRDPPNLTLPWQLSMSSIQTDVVMTSDISLWRPDIMSFKGVGWVGKNSQATSKCPSS